MSIDQAARARDIVKLAEHAGIPNLDWNQVLGTVYRKVQQRYEHVWLRFNPFTSLDDVALLAEGFNESLLNLFDVSAEYADSKEEWSDAVCREIAVRHGIELET